MVSNIERCPDLKAVYSSYHKLKVKAEKLAEEATVSGAKFCEFNTKTLINILQLPTDDEVSKNKLVAEIKNAENENKLLEQKSSLLTTLVDKIGELIREFNHQQLGTNVIEVDKQMKKLLNDIIEQCNKECNKPLDDASQTLVKDKLKQQAFDANQTTTAHGTLFCQRNNMKEVASDYIKTGTTFLGAGLGFFTGGNIFSAAAGAVAASCVGTTVSSWLGLNNMTPESAKLFKSFMDSVDAAITVINKRLSKPTEDPTQDLISHFKML